MQGGKAERAGSVGKRRGAVDRDQRGRSGEQVYGRDEEVNLDVA